MREDIKDLVKEALELNSRLKKDKARLSELKKTIISDRTLKENITPIPNALDKILSLSGNTFHWKPEANLEGDDTGIIAQEVEKLQLPGVTKRRQHGTLGVRYERLIPVLIEAIKELKSQVEDLKK